MTLDERIKASAEELGRLLREAEAEHLKRMAERDKQMEDVADRSEGPIARFFKEMEDLAKPIMVTVDNGKAFEAKEFGDKDAICRSIEDGQHPEIITITVKDGETLHYRLVKPNLEPTEQKPLRDKMLAQLRRDKSEIDGMRERYRQIAEMHRVNAHLERILTAIPVPTKEVIFIGIKGRVFAYDLMNEDGFRRMEKGEYKHVYKVVADGDSNRVIKISTEPEAEK